MKGSRKNRQIEQEGEVKKLMNRKKKAKLIDRNREMIKGIRKS